MPGRNPAEAVRSFLDPVRQGLACLGVTKVTGSKGFQAPKLGERHSWLINGGAGVKLRARQRSPLEPGTFYAAMWWHLIEDDREGYGPYRVTTEGYDYSLVSASDAELWAFHWHPRGVSDVAWPHLHLGDAVLRPEVLVASGEHLRTSRVTIETAVRWVLNWGAVAEHDDWDDRLTLAESPHLLYRSWADNPPA